jgi:hypothetical protein
MGPEISGALTSIELENLEVLQPGRLHLGPPSGRRGFAEFPEAPRFRLHKKRGKLRLPRDLERYSAYWLISDRAKTVLQSIDPSGFAFARCEVWGPDGLINPPFWLCDVVRVLDAVDEEASQIIIKYGERTGDKYYSLVGEMAIKEDVVGPNLVFRVAHAESWVFCDQEIKDACQAAGLKGISFTETLKR